jgi:hypothetical protein
VDDDQREWMGRGIDDADEALGEHGLRGFDLSIALFWLERA